MGECDSGNMAVTLIFLAGLSLFGGIFAQEPELDHASFLDMERDFHLAWTFNDTHVDLEYAVRSHGWIAFGLSPNGGMSQSDVMFAWVDDGSGEPTVQDRWLEVDDSHMGVPILDSQQDWQLISGQQNETHTIVRATRAISTCDSQDRPFTNATMRIIFSTNPRDPEDSNDIQKHAERGTKSLLFFSEALLKNRMEVLKETNLQQMDLRMDRVVLPRNVDTIYLCKLIKLPQIDRKYHIIGANPLIEKGNEHTVHHILVSLCTTDITDSFTPKEFQCNVGEDQDTPMMYCSQQLLSAWAVGGGDQYYPAEAGLPLTPEMSDRYAMIEIHYDFSHTQTTRPARDSSGMSFILTDQLRENDAAILTTGNMDMTYGMIIPPQASDFLVTAVCEDNCTSSFFPSDGINVFQVMLHTHLQGRKVLMRQIRNGQEISPLAEDENYDFNYQEHHVLNPYRKVFPGDRLLIECHYSTIGKSIPTFGGYRTTNEMCLVYLTYYPATPVMTCASLVNQSQILEFIEYTGETNNTSAVREFLTTQYTWSSDKVEQFQELYKKDQTKFCVTENRTDIRVFVSPMEGYVPYSEPSLCPADSSHATTDTDGTMMTSVMPHGTSSHAGATSRGVSSLSTSRGPANQRLQEPPKPLDSARLTPTVAPSRSSSDILLSCRMILASLLFVTLCVSNACSVP